MESKEIDFKKNLRSDVAFLAEGLNEPKLAPEVTKTIELAKTNECDVFDSIHSWDVLHLAECYKNANEETQKLIAVHVFMSASRSGDPEIITNELIIKPLQFLLQNKQIKKLPEFAEEFTDYFSDTKMDDLIFSVAKKYEKGEFGQAFFAARASIDKQMTLTSNNLSQEKLIQYLKDHQEIKAIFGLVGSMHLPMLENIGKTLIKNEVIDEELDMCTEGYYHIKLNIENRPVDVHLFGGKHKTLTQYNKMEKLFLESEYNLNRDKDQDISPSPAFFKK